MFVPKERKPLNTKKIIKYTAIIIGSYLVFVLLPYFYMKNQFSDFIDRCEHTIYRKGYGRLTF